MRGVDWKALIQSGMIVSVESGSLCDWVVCSGGLGGSLDIVSLRGRIKYPGHITGCDCADFVYKVVLLGSQKQNTLSTYSNTDTHVTKYW